MDKDALVAQVTAEVLRRLSQPGGGSYKALAIFTGGTTGFSTGLKELKQIQDLGTDITVVLSAAAEKVIGAAPIKEHLGHHINLITAASPYPKEILRAADVVLVPVLTQNTAAKIAHTITDTMASYLILSALLLNIPVIAAFNAADPQYRPHVEIANLTPALRQALQVNLEQLKSYGIQLTAIENLAAITKKILIKAPKISEPTPKVTFNKQVLDAETVRSALLNGEKNITIPRGTIVTPLARDIAREFNVVITDS